MLRKLSDNAALFLCKNHKNEREIIETVSYGIEAILSLLINSAIVFICGILEKNFIAAVVYYISFLNLRFLYGGYHAKSHIKCKLIFAAVTILVLFIDLKAQYTFSENIVLLLISVLPLMVCKPEINKDHIDVKKLKVAGIIFSLMWCVISLLLFNIKSEISVAITLSIAVVSLSLLIKKIKRR